MSTVIGISAICCATGINSNGHIEYLVEVSGILLI